MSEGRECQCPTPNLDCIHPTCPRVPEVVAPKAWRPGASWAAKDPAASPLVTIVETGTGEPGEQGRRADDVLVGALFREDAERLLALIDDALYPEDVRSWAKANLLIELRDVGERMIAGAEARE